MKTLIINEWCCVRKCAGLLGCVCLFVYLLLLQESFQGSAFIPCSFLAAWMFSNGEFSLCLKYTSNRSGFYGNGTYPSELVALSLCRGAEGIRQCGFNDNKGKRSEESWRHLMWRSSRLRCLSWSTTNHNNSFRTFLVKVFFYVPSCCCGLLSRTSEVLIFIHVGRSLLFSHPSESAVWTWNPSDPAALRPPAVPVGGDGRCEGSLTSAEQASALPTEREKVHKNRPFCFGSALQTNQLNSSAPWQPAQKRWHHSGPADSWVHSPLLHLSPGPPLSAPSSINSPFLAFGHSQSVCRDV